MIFQEELERIIEENSNIKVLKSDKSSCFAANFESGETFYLSLNEKEDKVIVNSVKNAFPDVVYKGNEINIDELESFLQNTSSKTIVEDFPPDIDDLGNKPLVLIGAFTQPMAFLEDENEGDVQNTYVGYKLLVEDELTNERYFLVAHESGGVGSDGYTMASFGEAYTEPLSGEVDMSNATFIPKDKMYLFVAIGNDDVDIYAGNTLEEARNLDKLLIGVSQEGGDPYYPSGFVMPNLTSKEFEGSFIVNEDVEKHISSLASIDLDDYGYKMQTYRYESSNNNPYSLEK